MAENEQQAAGAGQAQADRPQFALQKLYIKDASFEAPVSPHIFTQEFNPNVEVQLNINHAPLSAAQGIHEVVLAVTATARFDDKVAFLAEVQQGGVFTVSGVPAEELDPILEIACPNILLPFVREVVADLVVKGGFPQLLLNPVNFENLYRQKLARAAAGAQAGAAPAAEAAPAADEKPAVDAQAEKSKAPAPKASGKSAAKPAAKPGGKS